MKWLFFVLFFMTTAIDASVSNDLGNFFNGLGFSENATNPSAYHGQEAGYYTGGSLYARNSVRDYQLVSTQLPSVRAGCGGIDLYTGGFSFINSSNLVDAMENIANSAVTYAVMLGIETVTPEIANEMQTLQGYANKINQSNISSCEAAASLDGAIWPKTDAAQQQVCQSIGTSSGIYTDYTKARMECGDGGKRVSTLNNAKNDPAYKDMVIQNTNIAWKALQKNNFFNSDYQLDELLMSLSGTIIIKSGANDSAPNQFAVLPSLAGNQQLIKAIMYGGQGSFYHCDSTSDCLNPSLQNISVNTKEGLVNQVRALLEDMYNHILTDTPITHEEIGLLQSTNIPLYKMLNVEAAYTGGSSVLDLESYAELIATDILNQYLNENLDIIQKSAGVLQYPQAILSAFNTGMEQARTDVAKIHEKDRQAVDLNLQLIQRTQLMEQQLSGVLSSNLSNSLKWAQGLQ